MMRGSSSLFILSLPKREIDTPPKIGLIMKSWPTVEPPPVAARASTIRLISIMPRPLPPCSSGSATPARPASQTAFQYSWGKAFFSSCLRQYSRPNVSPIWRAVSIIMRCSSLSLKSMV
ncbi:hypothetical protein D3C71_1853920 [compost metagenome]